MNPHPSQPIGIFDSGIGGLTVARAIVETLPTENIIYFGDTAHLPYGDKSTQSIQYYSQQIAKLLLEKHCKLLLIACNSASAAAYQILHEQMGHQVILMNVIDPTIEAIKTFSPHTKIGLIGTRPTIHSHIYQNKIAALPVPIQLITCVTNLLASAIEEFGDHPLMDHLIHAYLSDSKFADIDALILACTHYPIIKNRIKHFFQKTFNKKIQILDSAELIAKAVKKTLAAKNLLNSAETGKKYFYVSDYTESFAAHAKQFFTENIYLEPYSFIHPIEIPAIEALT